MSDDELRAALATVRSGDRSAAERAAAAAAIALPGQPPPAPDGPSMYGFGELHPQARPWDGRSSRSGTITFVAADRVEQYAGGGRWTSFAPARLERVPAVGDHVRIDAGGRVEAIGSNRLVGNVPGSALRATGMMLRLDAAIAPAAVDDVVSAVRARHDGVALAAAADDAFVRIDVATSPDPWRAERALVLCAAVLLADASGGRAVDDVGAAYDGATLRACAVRDGTRADLFAFAAAAARRRWPLAGFPDELTLFFAAPHDAAEIASVLAGITPDHDIAAAIFDEPTAPDAVDALLAGRIACRCVFRVDGRGDERVLRTAALLVHRRRALALDPAGILSAPDDLVAAALALAGRAPSH